MTRSADLLARCGAELAASADRPLLRRFADGSVDDVTYERYLAAEREFVHTAARAVARCLAEEHDRTIAVSLGRIIADLTGAQEHHLAHSRRGAADPGMAAVLERAAVLSDHVESLVDAHGPAAAAVCLFAAETLYSRWCTAAARLDVSRTASLESWIRMHASDEFAAQARFWGGMVDRVPAAAVPDALLDDWFRGMLAAEDRFHDAPLLVPAFGRRHPEPFARTGGAA